MDLLNNRQNQIVNFLVKNGKTKCLSLCKLTKSSDKTVRNDIKSINFISHKVLIVSDTDGFFYIDPNYMLDAKEILNGSKTVEDENLILRHLLVGYSPFQVDEIAEHFNMSTSSLLNRIKNLNISIDSFNLVIRRKDSNLFISGSDFDKRRLFLTLIHKETDTSFLDILEYQSYFPDINIENVRNVILSKVKEFNYYIPEFYETNLLVNVFTILSLNSNNSDISVEVADTIESKIAHAIVSDLKLDKTSYFIKTIANTLTGIVQNLNYPRSSSSNLLPVEFQDKLQKSVADTFEFFSLDIDFTGFMPTFITHVYDLLNRLRSNNSFVLSSVNTVRESCYYVYDVAVFLSNKLDSIFNVVIPESEISLIAIHIGFVIENSFHKQQKVKLYLYTDNYPIIRKYITDKISEEYYDKIDVIVVDSIKEIILDHSDLLITTKSIIQTGEYEYCKISPLLTDTDKIKIKKSVFNAIDRQNSSEFALLVRKCFDKKLFFIDTSLNKKEQILDFLNLHLQLAGAVDDHFLDSVLKRESLEHTCFMNIYAMPHSFESNALKSKIAIYINPEGIQWTPTMNVNFVFLIAINRDENTILKSLYDGFANVLADDRKLIQLQSIRTFDEFIDCLIR